MTVINTRDKEHSMRKKGRLTAAGAKRLGFPQLANCTVEYEDGKHPERLTEAIYHQGRLIGGIMTLDETGIIALAP